MKCKRLKKSNLEDLNKLALDAVGETVTVSTSNDNVYYGVVQTILYQLDGSISVVFQDGNIINSKDILTFSTDEGEYVNIYHPTVNPYDDSNIWNTANTKYNRLKKAFTDPNIFLDYAKQFGVEDSTINNISDVAFRFNNGWSLYVGEDGVASDGTELFWVNVMTPMGEDMGSAKSMTLDATLQYIQMVGLRSGV